MRFRPWREILRRRPRLVIWPGSGGASTEVGTKQDLVIQMLGRQSGASIDEIAGNTGWQTHSVRGFLSAVVRRRLGLTLASEAGKDGVRRYYIAPIAASKA
jgi:Protein of unknown function (DUF3489)